MKEGVKLFFKMDNVLPIMIIMAIFVVRLFSQSANTIMLNYVMPLMMVWCIIKDPNLLKNNIIIIYIILLIWVLFTVFTGVNINRSLTSIRPTMGGLVTSIVMYSLSRKNLGNATWLLIAYVLLYFSSMLYLSRTGAIYELDVDTGRLSIKELNANDLAYFLFYSTIAFSLVGWNGHDKLSLWNILIYGLLVIFTLYTSVITASRQVLIFVLPFIMLSILFRMKGGKRLSGGFIFGILVFCVIAIIGYNLFVNRYIAGTFLEYRMQLDVEEDSRVELIIDAFLMGLKHPFFGVGPGNYELFSGGAFSHCSYTELFATSGLLAMVLFVIIVVKSARLHYSRYKETNNRIFLYLFVGSVFWALYNFFYAFYISPWLISFFLLMNGYSESIYKSNKCYEA